MADVHSGDVLDAAGHARKAGHAPSALQLNLELLVGLSGGLDVLIHLGNGLRSDEGRAAALDHADKAGAGLHQRVYAGSRLHHVAAQSGETSGGFFGGGSAEFLQFALAGLHDGIELRGVGPEHRFNVKGLAHKT